MPRKIPYLKPTWNQPPPGVKVLTKAGVKPGEDERERRRFYNSPAWRKLRRWFLGENPICVPCLEAGRLIQATHAHHVVERLDDPELALDPSNLLAVCNSCHAFIHKSKKEDGSSDAEA